MSLPRSLASAAVMAGIPIAMGACALLGWWLGSLLDGALHTDIAFQILLPLLFTAGSLRETALLLRRSASGSS
jgi:hypothetical protein